LGKVFIAMKNETIEILGVKLNKENFPVLYDWAMKDKEGLEQRILADLKPNEKPSTLLVMLEVDLEEQRLK